MKQFDQLDEDELVALTDDEISRYVDYVCAEQGIPLLRKAPTPPEKSDLHADMTVYEVGGFRFLTQKAAIKVLQVLREAGPVELEYQRMGPNKYEYSIGDEAHVPDEASARRVFSRDKISTHQATIDRLARAADEYNEQKQAYDNVIKRRREVEGPIFQAISEAKALVRKRQVYMEEFKTYLELADNRSEIAVRFLLKAKPDAGSVIQGLLDPLARQLLIDVELELGKETASV